MKSWLQETLRRKGQIYILPTKMGGYFNGLIFLMFLLSVGYSNNLLLIFTLFLFGLNLLWVIQTHFHLRDVDLDRLQVADGHAGELSTFVLTWKKAPTGKHKWELCLECDRGKVLLRALSENPQEVMGDLSWNKRGVWHWRYLLVATERPFGLYRAWRYIKMEGSSCVYPSLTNSLFTAPLSTLGPEGTVGTHNRGAGDFLELLPYSGDEARKISWKHYARTGELLIKEGEDEKTPQVEFSWVPGPEEFKEESLSALATQMVLCHRQNVPFTFEIGSMRRGPETSRGHLARCLEDLGQC